MRIGLAQATFPKLWAEQAQPICVSYLLLIYGALMPGGAGAAPVGVVAGAALGTPLGAAPEEAPGEVPGPFLLASVSSHGGLPGVY